MRQIQASKLIFNADLFPREGIDKGNVARLVGALEAGIELPPIVVCRKTLTIIDGVHRWRAHREYAGDDSHVACVEKDYKSKKEMFLDSIRFNAAHGTPLNQYDRCRIAKIALEFAYSDQSVALVLGVTQAAYAGLKPRQKATVSLTAAKKPAGTQSTESVTFAHVAGEAVPGSRRCHLCGANLLPDQECLKCNLEHPKKRAVLEREEREQDKWREADSQWHDSEPADGWQNRLNQLRAAKASGDELGFHLDWLAAYLRNPPADYDDHDRQRLKDMCQSLREFLVRSKSESAA